MTQESMYDVSYRCPSCGSTDLRAEAPVMMHMDEQGFLSFIDGCGPGNINDLIEPCYFDTETICNDCETCGKVPEFEDPPRQLPKAQDVADALRLLIEFYQAHAERFHLVGEYKDVDIPCEISGGDMVDWVGLFLGDIEKWAKAAGVKLMPEPDATEEG